MLRLLFILLKSSRTVIVIKMILLLLLLQLIVAKEFDDFINLVYPATRISHSSSDISSLKFLGIFNNCTCHNSPNVLVTCSGKYCYNFPTLNITESLFKLTLSSIEIIKKNDLLQLINIEALEVEGNNQLIKIESGCFKNLSRLRNLTISNNEMLNYLDENVFEGLKNLETLCLSKNGFRRVVDAAQALSPKYVPKLDLLDLSQNIFHTIEETEFHCMNGTNLEQLNMYLCGIVYIHPNCLEPFKNLLVLRLGQNIFSLETITNLIVKTLDYGIPLDLLNLFAIGLRKSLPMEMLEAVGKSNITDLLLAQNHFDQIDDDSLPAMPNLSIMDLRECSINSISDKAFNHFVNLTTLLINRNRLNSVPPGVLVTTLIILDLADNSAEEQNFFFIPDRIFENLTLLNNLQLSFNNIQYITNETFLGLLNLQKLNLRSAMLSYIENGAFLPTPNLTHLNLINNPLLSLMPMTAETFKGLGNLNIMLLASCGIKNLTCTPPLFHYTKNITYLGLYNNDIHIIASNQISNLKFLDKIDLENNKLTPWIKQILPRKEITKVVASQNKFTYITEAMLEDFKSVKYLNLDGNTFSCDCTFYPVVKWLKYNKLELNYSKDHNFVAKCDTPETWRTSSIVEYWQYLETNSFQCEKISTSSELIFIILLIIILFIIIIVLYLFRWNIRYWIFLYRISFIRHNFWTIQKKPDEKYRFEYDAFVSYSVEDSKWVSHLCSILEPDLKLCIFERDFPPGVTISHAVLNGVLSAKRTILVVSEAFAKSNWCRWETQLAQHHQLFFRQDSIDGPDDTLLVIRLQPVKKHLTPILKYVINTRIYLDWPLQEEKQPEFWNKLKVTLSAPKGKARKIA